MGEELNSLRPGLPQDIPSPPQLPAGAPPDPPLPPTQTTEDIKRVDEGYSRPIEKWLLAAALVPTLIVPPRKKKQLVVISCAFGGAVVSVSFRTQQKPFLVLPNAGTWEWILLGPEEGLLGATTANTVVTGVARDV